MSKTNEELQSNVDNLVYALGLLVGTVSRYEIDIEDEAYEKLMNELLTIGKDTLAKL